MAVLRGFWDAVTSFVDTTTFKSYWSSFRGYVRWCASKGVAVWSITANELTSFVACQLHQGGVMPSTVARDLSCICEFVNLIGWEFPCNHTTICFLLRESQQTLNVKEPECQCNALPVN